MPNYKYACEVCGASWNVPLPISSDPKNKITCKYRRCHGKASRRIIGGDFKTEKETFGDWYKKKTGKELLGD